MINISPTLIIGVGTSGLEMINSVRELFFEEFSTAGLPLVRFLHISSSEENEPFNLDNSNFNNNYEQIQIAKAYLNDSDHMEIRSLVDPASFKKDKDLINWLNPKIANIPGKKFNAGAGNIRQAGRLCLWRNWDNITTNGIFSAYGKLLGQAATDKTIEILEKYLLSKGITPNGVPLVSSGTTRIFLVGTLVGGTCSGMFIDLGFYLSNQFKDATIYGIFSTMDKRMSGRPDHRGRAANNYAALIELDYYMQYYYKYDYQLPFGFKVDDNKLPFNYVTLISTTNKNGSVAAVVNPNGDVDVRNVNKLVGMSIFFDIVAGAGNAKEQIKTDYENSIGTNLKVEDSPKYAKRLFAFGSSALWFPKNKIAGMIALNKTEEFTRFWLGDPTNIDKAIIDYNSYLFISNMEDEIRKNIVLHYVDGKEINIVSEIQQIFVGIKNIHKNTKTPINEIIGAYPEIGEPILRRFKNKGYYFNILDNNINAVSQMVVEKMVDNFNNIIEQILNMYPGKTNNSRTPNLLELNEIINRVYDIVLEKIKNNVELPNADLTIDDLNMTEYFKALAIEENRKSTYIALSRNRIIEQHYSRIFLELENGFNFFLENLTNYFVNICLEQILKKLKSSLLKQLTLMKDRVTALRDETNRRRDYFMPSTNFSALMYVFQYGSFDNDVKFYSEKISNISVLAQIASIHHTNKLYELLFDKSKNEKLIIGEFIIKIQKIIFDEMRLNKFDILDPAITPIAQQIKIASLSTPLFEVDNRIYVDLNNSIPTRPTVIAGGTKTSRENFRSHLIGKELQFMRDIQTDLDHLVYFYQEDGMISISELDVFSILKQQYDQHSSSPDSFGMHIDKNPTKFDITIEDLKEAIKKDNLLKLACDLFKRDLFIAEGNDPKKGYFLVFEYENRHNIKVKMYYPVNEPDYFIDQLTLIKEARDQFNEKFNNLIETLGRKGFDGRVDQYLYELGKKGISPLSDFYISEQKFYQEYAAKKYPNQTNDGDGNFAGAANIKHFNAPANDDETTFDEATITEFKGQNGNN